jgi:hypothetical protein
VTSVKVFDPAMCCSTGICGPSVDPDLVRFAADLDWLASEGVSVERFSLSQRPDAFVAHVEVTQALQERGDAALPLILVDGRKVIEGAYPSRDQLVRWAVAEDPSQAASVPEAAGAKSCSCGDGGCC